MNDDFKILLEFFEGGRPEVAGRAAGAIPAEVRERISKFARGDCTEEERAELKKLLQQQPDLIPVLVTETRSLRPSSE